MDPDDKSTFNEYVLDMIVERKTADDLAASLRDGWYQEQKWRLKHCGINNVIYLIEGSPGPNCPLPEVTLKSACLSTRISSGFSVLELRGETETLTWLTRTTKYL